MNIARTAVCIAAAFGFAYAPAAESWTVVSAEKQTDNERFAIWDFANHLEKIAGRADAGSAAEVRFEVGTDAAKAKALAKAEKLTTGDSVVVGEGKAIYIWGEGKAGVQNGVYCFLENRLGCRWLTAWGDDIVPKRDSLVMEPFVDVNRTVLKYRWLIGPTWMTDKRRNGMLFFPRNRLNTSVYAAWVNIDLPKGVKSFRPEVSAGQYLIHASTRMIPAREKYGVKGEFDAHPDWFSLDKKGKRTPNAQHCWTNPELRAEMTRRYLKQIGSFNKEGIYDISQDDGQGDEFCNCTNCMALVEKYGTPGAPLFDYVRELCGVISTNYPKAGLRFLVYRKTQTEFPPNAAFGRFPPNAYPMLAPINDDFSKALDEPPNTETLENFKRWIAISDHQWTWSYPMPYGGSKRSPYCAIWRWSRDMRILAEAGIDGYGFEHDVGYPLGITFADLQCWLMMKLMEDPHRKVAPLVADFCRNYYGAGAGDVCEFLRALETVSRENKTPMKWADHLPQSANAENLVKWAEMLLRAESKVAGDPALVQHVREAREAVDLYLLKRWKGVKALGFAETPDSVYNRLTNTVYNGFCRRSPGQDKSSSVWKQAVRMLADARVEYTKASRGSVLPPEFTNIPETDIIEIAADGDVMHDDSATGAAVCIPEDATREVGFECGAYDPVKKEFMSHRVIPWKDGVPDKFHFYKIGTIWLTEKAFIYSGWKWHTRISLGEYNRPGEHDRWDLWLSYKFEGPWVPGSKAKENRAWLERALLIRKH